MKTIQRLFLVFVIITTFTLTAFASDVKSNTSTTINEYDFLLDLNKESDSVLIERGYAANDIRVIRNAKEAYVNHLKACARLTPSALENLGYTKDQITSLQSFNGSESQIRALAATLDFNLTIDYVTWSSSDDRTNARLRFDFEWNGVPLIKTTDIIALSWNDWTINGKTAYVTYTNIYGNGSDFNRTATYVQNSGPTSYGGGYKFAMTQSNNLYWAKSGLGIFTLYHNHTEKDLSAYAEYGHSTITVTPTFSIPGYGSISFSYGTDTQSQAWADMEC
jgi:hypothetical protein